MSNPRRKGSVLTYRHGTRAVTIPFETIADVDQFVALLWEKYEFGVEGDMERAFSDLLTATYANVKRLGALQRRLARLEGN